MVAVKLHSSFQRNAFKLWLSETDCVQTEEEKRRNIEDGDYSLRNECWNVEEETHLPCVMVYSVFGSIRTWYQHLFSRSVLKNRRRSEAKHLQDHKDQV